MAENELEINPKDSSRKKNTKKVIWIIGGVVIIAAIIAALILTNQAKKAGSQAYTTQTITKGNLVAMVGETGTVRANQTAILNWQTTGTIEKINYQIGDQVPSGAVMASLAATSMPQSVLAASANLITAQQNLDTLENSSSDYSNAVLNLAQAQRNYNTALGNYFQKDKTQGTANLITVTEAKLQIMDNNIVDLKKNYDNMAELPDNDSKKALALQNLTQAQIDRDNEKKLLDYYKALPDNVDVDILKGKLDVAKAALEDAQRQYDLVKNGTNPDDVASAQANVNALQATVNMGFLTAPFSGTVTEMNSMVGDMVSMGTNTFRIDDMSRLLVDAYVPEVDINSIKAGQDASLTFDAIANQQYAAKVIQVARVGDTIGGVVNFKVTLQILNPDAQVLPGMTAAINITVTQLKNVITVPNRAVRTVNSQLVVYVLKNGQPVPVNITLGAASDTNSQVVSGDIKEGDTLILNPPSSLLNLMQSGSAAHGPVN